MSTKNSTAQPMDIVVEDVNMGSKSDTTTVDTNKWDRTQALEAVARDAAQVWSTLPEEFQFEKEFVLQALNHSPTLPGKSNFERAFPQSLRFDKEVVLAFCARDDFEELYYERHLFVPGCWSGDKQVMMAYCQKIPRSLQECTEELCNDRQVVQAAVSLGGLELQYASLRLQEDKPMVMQACQSHGRALEYCPPGPTRSELVHDRDFMLQVVLAKPGGGPMWKLAPASLQREEPVLLQALKNGLPLRHVPMEFMHTEFLERAMQENASLYLQLTDPWPGQVEIALQAVLAEDSTPQVHRQALDHCPSLQHRRDAVLAICQRGDVELVQELLSHHVDTFCDDTEIMKLAVTRDSKLFSLASPRLQQVPEIILASITPNSAWNTVKTVSWSIQRENPEITIKAITLCSLSNLRYLPRHIPEDMWAQNRNVCLAWIRRGGRVLEYFQPLLRTDHELAFAVARHYWTDFHKVGEELLADRDFMLQALEHDGRVLRFATPVLRQDLQVLVTAAAHYYTNHDSDTSSTTSPPSPQQQMASIWSTTRPPIHASFASAMGDLVNVSKLQRHIEEQLQLQESFLLDFLRGIAIVTPHIPPPRRSQLPMLDRGVETSQAFKQLISEYLGVPVGHQLTLLRRAKSNLELGVSSGTEDSRRVRPARMLGDPRPHFDDPTNERHRRRLMLQDEMDDDLEMLEYFM